MAYGRNDGLCVWEYKKTGQQRRKVVDGLINEVTWSGDGRMIAAAGFDGRVWMVSTATWGVVYSTQIADDRSWARTRFTADGREVVTTQGKGMGCAQ